MTESKLFIDSSAWLAYFLAVNNRIKDLIENDGIIFTSALSLFEIKRKLLRDHITDENISAVISFIISRSIVLDLTPNIAEAGALLSVQKKLPAIDALIYASAREHDAVLVTGDYDFKGCEEVLFLSENLNSKNT